MGTYWGHTHPPSALGASSSLPSDSVSSSSTPSCSGTSCHTTRAQEQAATSKFTLPSRKHRTRSPLPSPPSCNSYTGNACLAGGVFPGAGEKHTPGKDTPHQKPPIRKLSSRKLPYRKPLNRKPLYRKSPFRKLPSRKQSETM